nr:MAG: hypothetical protein [Caudoviricetes sp.]
MKNCPKCNKEHDNNGKFCSRSCANSRVWSEEINEKRRKKLKGKTGQIPWNKGKNIIERVRKVCEECNTEFEILKTHNDKNNPKYCSSKCAYKNAGGYREGSGRAKSGYYKGIYCGSTYELAWVIYQIDNNIEFQRFDGILEFEGKKYIPDFLQNGKIIEIKGYEKEESVEKKTIVANKNGFEVLVLRKEDLKVQFDWVESKYKTKEYYTLYDEYKPKYEYICEYCKNIFYRERKTTSEYKFCNKICAGKGHKGRGGNKLGINQYTKNKVPID